MPWWAQLCSLLSALALTDSCVELVSEDPLCELDEVLLEDSHEVFLMQTALELRAARTRDVPVATDAHNGLMNHMHHMREVEPYMFPALLGCGMVLLALSGILAHEVVVFKYGQSPALAIPLPDHAWWLRWVLLLACCQNFVEATTCIPLSYDLVSSLGGASPGAMSGLLVGMCFFGFAPGGRIAIKTLPGLGWCQARVRRRLLYAFTIDIFCHLVTTVILLVSGIIPWPMLCFWCVVALRTCSGLCIGYNMIGVMLLGQRITPPSLRNDYSILVQVMRNSGFMLGPGLSSLVLWSYRKLDIVASVFEEAAATNLLLAGTTVLLMALFAVAMPLDEETRPQVGSLVRVAPAQLAESVQGRVGRVLADSQSATPYEVEFEDGSSAWFAEEELTKWIQDAPTEAQRPGQVRLEDFPDKQRQQVVWLLTSYGAERAFTIAGVEVATLMMLETTYGWSVEMCGFVLTTVAGLSNVGCLTLLVLLRNGLVAEKPTFRLLATCSLIGGALLFQFSRFGPISLLTADTIIYCSASVANGVAEGWATRAVKPGTSFNNETRLVIMVTTVTLARLVSPPLSRGLIELGGRNAYAAMQLVLIVAGFMTVMKVYAVIQSVDKASMNGNTLAEARS